MSQLMRRGLRPGSVAAGPSQQTQQPGKPERQFSEDYFTYSVIFEDLAPGATQNGNIQVQADANFKWIKSTYQADIAFAAYLEDTRPVPLVAITVFDSGSGRQLSDQPIPIENNWGRGELPFILPIARVFQAKSNIRITATNFDAAVTYNLQLALIGMKQFEMSGQP